MTKIIAFIYASVLLFGLSSTALASDTQKYNLSTSFPDLHREVTNKMEFSNLFVRCAGLYSTMYKKLEPMGLEKAMYDPYLRSTIILKRMASGMRGVFLMRSEQIKAPITDEQNANIFSGVENEISEVENLYIEAIGRSSVDVQMLLEKPQIKTDLLYCKHLSGSLAPDADRGTPGKLPRLIQ